MANRNTATETNPGKLCHRCVLCFIANCNSLLISSVWFALLSNYSNCNNLCNNVGSVALCGICDRIIVTLAIISAITAASLPRLVSKSGPAFDAKIQRACETHVRWRLEKGAKECLICNNRPDSIMRISGQWSHRGSGDQFVTFCLENVSHREERERMDEDRRSWFIGWSFWMNLTDEN